MKNDENNLTLLEIPEIMEKQQKGILPTIIKQLVDRRKTIKQLLRTERDPIKIEQLNIRQLALKLTANSIYGESNEKGSARTELCEKSGATSDDRGGCRLS